MKSKKVNHVEMALYELFRPSGYALGLILTVIPFLFKLYSILAEKRRPSLLKPGPSADLKTQFPPSCRQALSDPAAAKYQKLLGESPPDTAVQSRQLPSTLPSLTKSRYYTPTGFSTGDIEALGRFPDYSILSGVPHPKPCPEFDINTACFRPYRPFRWAYHQTMCKPSIYC